MKSRKWKSNSAYPFAFWLDFPLCFFFLSFFWHKFYVYFSHFLFITSDESFFLCSRKVEENFYSFTQWKTHFEVNQTFKLEINNFAENFRCIYKSHLNLKYPKVFTHCQFLCDFLWVIYHLFAPFFFYSFVFSRFLCKFYDLILWKQFPHFFSLPTTLNSFLKKPKGVKIRRKIAI